MENSTYKRFSKAWFENYWYYYKWFTIGGIAILLAVILMLAECVFEDKPDFSLNYMGNPSYNFIQMNAYTLEGKLAENLDDINGDKKSLTKVNLVYLDKSDKSKEAAFMFQLADVEMAGGEAAVYVFDKEYVGKYAHYGFNDLSELVAKYNVDQDKLVFDEKNGYPYAISLKGNKILESCEIQTEELYLVIRPLRPNENKQLNIRMYENSLKMADYIISQN